MVATAPRAETRTLLKNISWQTFKTILDQMGGERQSRLAYDNQIVEIITPLMPHENSNRIDSNFDQKAASNTTYRPRSVL